MGRILEELDYQQTPMGALVLRRRRSPAVPDGWVYEIKINNEMLMSNVRGYPETNWRNSGTLTITSIV